jgi:hypothetical protein
MQANAEGFHHRRRADGLFQSICLRCYLTAGLSEDEQALAAREKHHVCDPSIIATITGHDVTFLPKTKRRPEGGS